MFGSLGIWEIVFIVILGLLIFGPKKLPEVSRTIGRTLGELRRSAEEFKHTVEREASDVQNSVETVARGSASTDQGDVSEGAASEGTAADDTASQGRVSEDAVSEDSVSKDSIPNNGGAVGESSADLSAGDRS